MPGGRGNRNGGAASRSRSPKSNWESDTNFDANDLESVLSSHTFLERLMGTLKPRLDDMIKAVTDPLFKRINDLELENRQLREGLKTETEKKLDELEQHGRLNSLRLYNVPEKNTKENCDKVVCEILNKHLNANINTEDIDISHPLGEPKDGKVNIIVKFVQRSKRHEIFKKKRLFSTKKSGLVPNPTKISVGEDLTKTRQKMMKRLNLLYKDGKIHSSWTYNGNVFIKKGESDRPKKLNIVFNDKDVDDQI